jgi:hypothetical protein
MTIMFIIVCKYSLFCLISQTLEENIFIVVLWYIILQEEEGGEGNNRKVILTVQRYMISLQSGVRPWRLYEEKFLKDYT